MAVCRLRRLKKSSTQCWRTGKARSRRICSQNGVSWVDAISRSVNPCACTGFKVLTYFRIVVKSGGMERKKILPKLFAHGGVYRSKVIDFIFFIQ
jgi:hypothetical protein